MGTETERAGRIDAMATGYDDFSDMLGRRGRRLDPAVWDDLVDRLAGHDVTHLGGGSGAASRPADADLAHLIPDLARAPEPRLRDALIALLLRHPEDAAAVRAAMADLPRGDPAWMSLLARLLAAAALQREHAMYWARALPGHAPIDVADLVAALDLPSPEEEDGRALLAAAQELVRGRHRTLDYVDGWEDVARHALREAVGVAGFERLLAKVPAKAAVGAGT